MGQLSLGRYPVWSVVYCVRTSGSQAFFRVSGLWCARLRSVPRADPGRGSPGRQRTLAACRSLGQTILDALAKASVVLPREHSLDVLDHFDSPARFYPFPLGELWNFSAALGQRRGLPDLGSLGGRRRSRRRSG